MSKDYQSVVDQNGQHIVPMMIEYLRGVLGDMCGVRENENIISLSTVRGYCTAIKLYTRGKAAITAKPQERVTLLKDFQEGYQKVAAQRKLNG